MADSIRWLLNADASQVRAEMTQAVASVSSATSKMQRDLDGVSTTHNSLLRSDHRVAASLRGLASEAITTGDAWATAGRGLESLAMATNVGLPALIGLEVIGTLIQKISKAHEEAVKLNKELEEAGKPRDPKSTIPIAEDIKQRREISEKARKAREEEETGSHWYNPFSWKWGEMGAAIARGDRQTRQSGFGGDVGMVMHPEDRRSQARTETDVQIEKEKAANDAADAIERQAAAEKKLADIATETARFKEKLQFSLSDIAKEGIHRKTGTFDSGAFYGGDVAQRALNEEKLARKAVMGQHYDEAIKHQSLAEELKMQIPGLKDSEKIGVFKTALDSSERLREIRDKVSFAGK